MADWKSIVEVAPEFAAAVQARFDSGVNKTLATLRADGSPRISGIELKFDGDRITLGMMPGSRKLADVLRDPRVAIHSPTIDPPEGKPTEWVGEAKLAGRLVPTPPPADSPVADAGYFELDVTEAVHTRIDETATYLVVESWTPARGYRKVERE